MQPLAFVREIKALLREFPAWALVLAFTLVGVLVRITFGDDNDVAQLVLVGAFVLTLVPRGWSRGFEVYSMPLGIGLLLRIVELPRGIEYAIFVGVSTLLAAWLIDREPRDNVAGEPRSASRGERPSGA